METLPDRPSSRYARSGYAGGGMMTVTELRVLGPPGCGKTTRLVERIGKAAQAFGENAVLVTSFTRAAAYELASRELDVDRRNVGTLHAICYRALGQPTIAETKIDEWNAHSPHLALSTKASASALDEPSWERDGAGTDGDSLSAEFQRNRAIMMPFDAWRVEVRAFANRWHGWKKDAGYFDFTDMLENGLTDFDGAPGAPVVAFVDEAQDLSALQAAVIRKWAERMQYVVLAGDDDQVLYSFAGASADVLIDPPLPANHVEILAQSYRVPTAVHALASRWIAQVSRRADKPYHPRVGDAGEVVESAATHERPDALMDELEDADRSGETTMILGSCSYHVEATIRELRRRGVRFHRKSVV